MELDFTNAKQNLYNEYKTASGADIPDELTVYYELYRDVFCDAIEVELLLGCEFDFCKLLENASRAEYFFDLSDLIGELPHQLAHIAAFGLVVFDRLVRARTGTTDLDDFFFKHEMLFECFELVRGADQASKFGRDLANKRHAKSREARFFVVEEWGQHWQDYKGNKSAFARDYVRRVWREFEIKVTEKQLREVWLRDNQIT
jgi:hypothetical protein